MAPNTDPKVGLDAEPDVELEPEPGCVWKLSTYCNPHYLDALSGILFESGAAGLEELPGGFAVYPTGSAQLATFRSAIRSFERRLDSTIDLELAVELTQIACTWDQSWQSALRAAALTSSLVFRPTHDLPAPEDEETLWFEPQTSFGTGEHPTTRLAASYIESFMLKRPGSSMMDVGCGSGVLTMVAKRRGAGKLVAVDIDAISVEATRANLDLNALGEGVRLLKGSADATDEEFDLVVANINTPILRSLVIPLAQRLNNEGTLILTGLLEEDVSELISLYKSQGLRSISQQAREGWVLLEWSNRR